MSAITPEQRLSAIVEIIDGVETRCMAVDGPVTPTCQEIRDEELRKIYRLASGKGKTTRSASGPTLKRTNEPPREAGWFWYREDSGKKWVLCRVYDDDGWVVDFGVSWKWVLDVKGEWEGPVPTPVD